MINFNEIVFENKVHTKAFCAFIRHGERADNLDQKERERLGIEIDDINDAPLTPLGFQ